jgi:hypothetical protein
VLFENKDNVADRRFKYLDLRRMRKHASREDVYDLYSSPKVICGIKPRRII